MKVEQNVKSGNERLRKLEDLPRRPRIQNNRKIFQKESRDNGGEGNYFPLVENS